MRLKEKDRSKDEESKNMRTAMAGVWKRGRESGTGPLKTGTQDTGTRSHAKVKSLLLGSAPTLPPPPLLLSQSSFPLHPSSPPCPRTSKMLFSPAGVGSSTKRALSSVCRASKV